MKALISYLLSAIVATAAFGADRQSAPLEVKGFPLGGSKTDLLAKFPFLHCDIDSCYYILTTCNIERERRCDVADDYKVGDVPITWHVSIKDDRVTRITFVAGSANFQELLVALIGKFGKPASSKASTVQNSFGAKFDDQTIIWKRGRDEVRALQRFGNLNQCAVMFSTPEAWGQDALNAARRASKDAAGL